MRIVVDRIEDKIAVVELESGQTVTIPASLIADAKEGDAIVLTVEPKNSAGSSTASDKDTHSIFERLRKKSDNNNN